MGKNRQVTNRQQVRNLEAYLETGRGIDTAQSKLAVQVWKDKVQDIVAVQKTTHWQAVRKIMRAEEYRFGFLLALRERLGEAILTVNKFSIGAIRNGVSIQAMLRVLEEDAVKGILIHILEKTTDGKLSGMELVIVLGRLLGDWKIYTLEEVLRVMYRGRGGAYGEVYSGKASEVCNWFEKYNEEMEQWLEQDYRSRPKGPISEREYKAKQNTQIGEWDKAVEKKLRTGKDNILQRAEQFKTEWDEQKKKH